MSLDGYIVGPKGESDWLISRTLHREDFPDVTISHPAGTCYLALSAVSAPCHYL